MLKSTVRATTLIVAAASLMGCAPDLERELATAAVTSSLESAGKQSAVREVVEAMDDCDLTAEQAVQEAADRPVVGLIPSSCVDKLPNGNALHVEYDGCTGVFGQVEYYGGVDAAVEVTGACQLHAEIVDSGDLTANGKPLAYKASADIEVSDAARDVDWWASWSGETAAGKSIRQSSRYDVLIDHVTSCRDIAGTAEGQLDDTEYAITVEHLSICPNCPSSGSVVARWEGAYRDREVTVAFDGSNVASVTGWSGRVFDVEMGCDAAVERSAE